MGVEEKNCEEMRVKKIVWALVLVAIIGLMVWSNDPIDDTMNFIIGGSIPGTKLALGFWPTIGVIGTVLLLIHRGLRHTRLQMLENTAKQIKSENAKNEFRNQNSGEFDPKQRSVIAARKTELSI